MATLGGGSGGGGGGGKGIANALNFLATSAGAAGVAVDGVADAQKKLADAASALNMALAVQKDAAAHAAAVLKDTAAAAVVAADAFGRVAGGLTEMKLAADGAALGLQGVDWAIRRATPATVALTDAQKALIESLAKVSDAGGASSLWVGHLISQLEAGTLSFEDFQKQVNETLTGLSRLGPVMGITADELNAINTILSTFKNNAAGGWPGGGP